ncbi:MAG: hypothetical protein IJL38_06875 [Bacteroidales bacterium]|nr:hypothetical protein [Bacteroidales bacterium]
MVAASCQKEEIQSPIPVEQKATDNIVNYMVDGQSYQAVINSELDWSDFLYRMLALAEEGHTVTISSRVSSTSSTREVVTYTTTSKPDAHAWADNMIDQGYQVTITYDGSTGIFTCIAVKK